MTEHTHHESPFGDPSNIFAAMMAQGDPPNTGGGEGPQPPPSEPGDPPNTGGDAPTPIDPDDETGDPPNTGGDAPTPSQPGDPPNTGG